ncbi:MAG TPA: hypothetical protein VFG42_11860 [Baekduia sp.]|uniref:hypothetical protein n=1 Tax=Baekduia sp. TaxID=2600305 RepID=UPI002D777BA9|nr:hypothetical protein [Baekduia sp.]HET6507473.1 hypothetical protein [Baekduia sp.]
MVRRVVALVTVLSVLAVVTGCGVAASPGTRAGQQGGAAAIATTSTTAAACARTDASELRVIARRLYTESAGGANVVSAQRRLARSGRLAAAVAAGSPARTEAALKPLLRSQITRIAIWTPEGRTLARDGTTDAPAPVSGTITDALGLPVGHYLLSVSSDAALAGELAVVTGARARVGSATADDGPSASSASTTPVVLPETAYPDGPLNVSLTVPPAMLRTCGATAAATRMAVVAAVGRRVLYGESDGSEAHRVLHHVATDRGFEAAVAHRDPVALRAAIVRFFRTPWMHVVRIRATDAQGHLIGDVGGPYVLSPISGPVVDAHGRQVGTVTLSVQDDSGYVKLLDRFTGAEVQLVRDGQTIPQSNLLPVDPSARTTLTATAFPSGPLQVVLELAQA